MIPSSVKYTDPSAFAYCTNITGQMNIPALLSNLGEYTFYGCNGISGFTVDKSNTRYAAYDGILYNSTLDTLLICPLSKTGKIEVPLSVKSIGVAAFDGCANLTEVNLPASLTIIENYAFEYCTGLTKFRIPRDIQKIGYAAFYNCNALTEVGIENPTPPIIEYYTFDQVNKTTCKLLVPEGAKINYENAPYWRTFEQIIETKFETGINKLHNQHYTLTSYKSIITINGLTQGDLISVFSPNGLLIKVIKSYDTTVSFNLPNQGVYIIKMPLETTKIIL